jgi:probable F420-dependent oxidoreductase
VVKFGLSIPTLTGYPRAVEPVRGWRERYERTYEIAGIAEELGYDFGTVGQHRFTPANIDSSAPLVSLAAIAARTTTFRLCTNILLLPTHNPIDVAEQAAVLDELSDGRLILGVGIGYRPYEFEGIGLNPRERAARAEEAIEVLRLAWGEEPVDFHGRFYQVYGADVSPKPVQRPGPPIWIGAQADAAIARAARLGDGWLTENSATLDILGGKIARYRADAGTHGRPGVVALNRLVGIGESRQDIEDGWLQGMMAQVRTILGSGNAGQDAAFAEKVMSGAHIGLDELPKGQLIAGNPQDCIAAVQACLDEVNPEYIVCDFGRGAHGEDYPRLKAMIELFGRQVIPAFS